MIRTGNYIGSCPSCRKVFLRAGFGSGACCSRTFRLEEIIGEHSPGVKCGGRCTNAKGPSCDCMCSGINHGKGHLHEAA